MISYAPAAFGYRMWPYNTLRHAAYIISGPKYANGTPQ